MAIVSFNGILVDLVTHLQLVLDDGCDVFEVQCHQVVEAAVANKVG